MQSNQEFSPLEPSPSPELSGSYLQEGEPSRKRRRVVRGCLMFIWDIVQTLVIAGVLYLGINALTARVRVEGSSMMPTFHSGEFVLVFRMAYDLQPPQRGDVVIFHPNAFPGNMRLSSEDYIKRIIGLPGERVDVRGGTVYINGVSLNEPYIAEPPRYHGSWEVPEGYVFVLGDNRNNSTDSHVFGPVPIESIVGRAVLVYWPVDAVRLVRRPDYSIGADTTTNVPRRIRGVHR